MSKRCLKKRCHELTAFVTVKSCEIVRNHKGKTMNYTDISSENQQAKQQMNQMYLDQTGAKTKKSVITFFAKSALPFAFASICFSAFGFYYDMIDGLGIIPALFLAIIIALFIEGSKHFSTKGAFADFDDTWRIALGGLAFLFTLGAGLYHYKSLNTYSNIQVRDALEQQNNREYALKDKVLAQVAISQKNNEQLSAVLKNGTATDDKSAVSAIASNNNLSSNLLSMDKKSDTSDSLLTQANKTALQNKNTLLVIFISVEIFSLFGVIAQGLLASETSPGIKELVKTQDKLNALEENVIQIVETALINKTLDAVQQKTEQLEQLPREKQVVNSVAVPIEEYKALPCSAESSAEVWSNTETPALPNYSRIVDMGGKKENIFFKGSHEDFVDAYSSNTMKVEKFPIVPKKKKVTKSNIQKIEDFQIFDEIDEENHSRSTQSDEFSHKIEFDPDFIAKEDWDNLDEFEKKIALSRIDLTLYHGVGEVAIIQALYDNGLINTWDEPLVTKREVVARYKAIHGGTLANARDIYEDVLGRLMKAGYVQRRARYYNKCQGIGTIVHNS